jgi:tetratricopeptide (TPR) repeat protein
MRRRESSTEHRAGRAALLLLLVAALSGAALRSASAQSKQDGCLKDPVCKDHYNKALKLYDEGRYADALPQFEEAYSRRQMPWLMLNIGRTMQRLGRGQEAISYYERYKKAELNLDAATLERVNKYIEQAQALVEKPPEEKPLEPRPTKVDPPPVTTPPVVAAPGVVPPGPDASEKKPVYKKWWFWTLIGVVAVGAVAGGVAGGLASKKTTTVPPPDPFLPTDPIYMPTF